MEHRSGTEPKPTAIGLVLCHSCHGLNVALTSKIIV
jgi:hypothetical protein